MSNVNSDEVYDYEAEHPTPWYKKKAALVLYGLLGGLLIGGVMFQGSTTEVEVAGPTTTVTPEPEVSVETKTVSEVPDICIKAMDEADDILLVLGMTTEASATGFGIAADMVEAAILMDYNRLDSLSYDLDPVIDDIDTATNVVANSHYGEYSTQCRNS